MTTRRLKRLKQLATGTALVASTLSAGDPPKPSSPKPNAPTPIRVNAPHDEPPTINAPPPAPEPPQPRRDAGVTEPKAEEPRVPVRINSTPRQPPKK